MRPSLTYLGCTAVDADKIHKLHTILSDRLLPYIYTPGLTGFPFELQADPGRCHLARVISMAACQGLTIDGLITKTRTTEKPHGSILSDNFVIRADSGSYMLMRAIVSYEETYVKDEVRPKTTPGLRYCTHCSCAWARS